MLQEHKCSRCRLVTISEFVGSWGLQLLQLSHLMVAKHIRRKGVTAVETEHCQLDPTHLLA